MIVAVATATVIKQYGNKKKHPLKEVLAMCQNVIQEALYTAIKQKRIIAIHFFFNEQGMLTHIGDGFYHNLESGGKEVFNKKIVPHEVMVRSFIVNGKDEMQTKSKQIWVLVFPEGYLQEVSFSLQLLGKDVFAYEINPFSGVINYAKG